MVSEEQWERGAQKGSVHPLYRRAITTYPTNTSHMWIYCVPFPPCSRVRPIPSFGLLFLPFSFFLFFFFSISFSFSLSFSPCCHERHFVLRRVANASAMTAAYFQNDWWTATAFLLPYRRVQDVSITQRATESLISAFSLFLSLMRSRFLVSFSNVQISPFPSHFFPCTCGQVRDGRETCIRWHV